MDEKNRQSDRRADKTGIGRVPSRFWYAVGIFAARLVQWSMRVRIKTDPDVRQMQGPAIILGNHPSYLDPFLVTCGTLPLHVNFLAQNDLFRNKLLKCLLQKIGCIPKVQFRTDTRAIKAMFRVLRRGGFLGIFPEGTRSTDGTGQSFENVIARTAKKNGAAVIVAKISGAYLSWPRWSKKGSKIRFGRAETHVRVLYTHAQVAALSAEEIHEGMLAALAFNDYDWQRARPRRFASRRPADGVDRILHKCPRCQEDLSIRAEGHRIYCVSCGNHGVMDAYGLFHPMGEADVIPGDPAQWHAWQKEQMAHWVEEPDFVLESEVSLLEISNLVGRFQPAGKGLVRVEREGIRFLGTVKGEAKEFFVRLARIPGFNADYGKRFELVLKDVSYRMYLKNGQMVIMFLDAVEALRIKARMATPRQN